MMENNFNSNKNSREKIFTTKIPGSRVMMEIINELRIKINEQPDLTHENYIFYKGIEKVNGDYYLIRKNEGKLIPYTKYIENNSPSLKQIIKWGITIASVAARAENEGYNLPVITVQSLYIDEENKIKIINPAVIDSIVQYRNDILAPIAAVQYKAPEIINGSRRDKLTVIYSLGILMYYLTTGRVPFIDKNSVNVYDQILTGSIIEPCYYNHKVSTDFNKFLLKLLSSQREERAQEWKEVITQLNFIKNRKLYLADSYEVQVNKKESEKNIKIIYCKQKLRFFFRHHWKKVALLLMLVMSLLYVIITDGSVPVVTENSPPEQVVQIFYKGINNNNINIVQETTTVKLGKLENLLSESYILEQMKKAYGDNNSGQKKIIGINNLQIEVKDKVPVPVYLAEYIFFLNQEEGKLELEMNDVLTLNRVKDCWQITGIKGDINNLICGNFNKLQESEK